MIEENVKIQKKHAVLRSIVYLSIIVSIGMGYVLFRTYYGPSRPSSENIMRTRIDNLYAAIISYKIESGEYPFSGTDISEILLENKKFLTFLAKTNQIYDIWGRPYIISIDDNVLIVSSGSKNLFDKGGAYVKTGNNDVYHSSK